MYHPLRLCGFLIRHLFNCNIDTLSNDCTVEYLLMLFPDISNYTSDTPSDTLI